jgi:Tfp pilus assembly protein PilO
MNFKNFRLSDLLNRNTILVLFAVLFIFANSMLYSYLYDGKYELIKDLEQEQKIVNEKFITAQILSEKLNSVYQLFESNLATNSNDTKNKEANMIFLKELTDVLDKLDIKLLQIEPGSKNKKGVTTYIPYSMEIKCDYDQFGKFITALEGNNRLISVEEIQIRNGVEKIRGAVDDISEINDIITNLSINTITLNKKKIKK